jgi:hypothetical protein
VERLLVRFLSLLTRHRCGVLIVEEAQERNMVTAFGREFLTFFLRLMNYSIPVLLIGNPLAFTDLDTFAQDVSRFTQYGRFRFDPVLTWECDEWETDWLHQAWRPLVLCGPDVPFDGWQKQVFDYCGGFPQYLIRLRMESEKCALLMGANALLGEHIELAWNGAEMMGVRMLIDAFVKKDAQALTTLQDIDLAYYASLWVLLKESGEQDPPEVSQAVDAQPPPRPPNSPGSSADNPKPSTKPKPARRRRQRTDSAEAQEALQQMRAAYGAQRGAVEAS